MMKKNLTIFELNGEMARLKKEGKSIALCDGFFNKIHIGHIRYLKQAKNISDVVVVSIVSDENLDVQTRLSDYFHEKDRAAALAELPYVDFVVVNPYSTLGALVKEISPNTLVEGSESNSNGSKPQRLSDFEKDELKRLGIEVIRVKEDEMVSTLQINRYISSLPSDIRTYIDQFKKRFKKGAIVDAIGKMKDRKVLVIGDTIIDEYQYCTGIGKSSKDPTLAIKYESHDVFAGGVLAVANHLAGFASKVDLVTILGEKNSYEEFIRAKLLINVSPQFLIRPHATTLIKRRFIEGYSMTKLLEVYEMDDSCLDGEINHKFNNLIFPRISECDLIVIADFGHGTINQGLKNALSEIAPFLAVNAQSNAGNRGFNNITKYPKADYVSMAEHEIRLEMRDLNGRIQPMMKDLLDRLHCKEITVTRGRKGCMILNQNGEFYQVPSFVTNVVDRVGAGDALFAVTSLAASAGAPAELIAFLGNVAGAIAVEIMGNQKYISTEQVMDYISRLYHEAGATCAVNF
jgi:rfaE bifunctional protein kinase chain/domain